MGFLLFNLLVVALILFDLGLGRRQQTPTARQAITRTLFYVAWRWGSVSGSDPLGATPRWRSTSPATWWSTP